MSSKHSGRIRGHWLITGSAALASLLIAGCPFLRQTPTGGTLTLQLEPSLNGDGVVKATSITKAELLNDAGAILTTGRLSNGSVVFTLDSAHAGDLFVRVNGLGDDLVPTRVGDPLDNLKQFVDTTLHVSVIGSLDDPTYRIKTFSAGQGEHPIVRYSDGTVDVPARYAYLILSLKSSPQTLEIRALGTATLATSFTQNYANHPSPGDEPDEPFATWTLGVQSTHHHGEAYGDDGARCVICHTNLDVKPPHYADIAPTGGWCYRCHNGPAGNESGFVNPSK